MARQVDWIARARRAIERDTNDVYDCASHYCQIVGNVKHMHWFVQALAKWLAGEVG